MGITTSNISNLTANQWKWNFCLYSLECKLIKVGWIIHFWLLNKTHFVWSDTLTISFNNPIDIFLIHQSESTLNAQIWKDWVETGVYANHNKEASMVVFKKNLIG